LPQFWSAPFWGFDLYRAIRRVSGQSTLPCFSPFVAVVSRVLPLRVFHRSFLPGQHGIVLLMGHAEVRLWGPMNSSLANEQIGRNSSAGEPVYGSRSVIHRLHPANRMVCVDSVRRACLVEDTGASSVRTCNRNRSISTFCFRQLHVLTLLGLRKASRRNGDCNATMFCFLPLIITHQPKLLRRPIDRSWWIGRVWMIGVRRKPENRKPGKFAACRTPNRISVVACVQLCHSSSNPAR